MSRYAGRLQLFADQWSKITSDKTILEAVRGYKIPFVMQPVQKTIPCPTNFNPHDTNLISHSIEKLLLIGALEKVSDVKGQFISTIFTVPKRTVQFV